MLQRLKERLRGKRDASAPDMHRGQGQAQRRGFGGGDDAEAATEQAGGAGGGWASSDSAAAAARPTAEQSADAQRERDQNRESS